MSRTSTRYVNFESLQTRGVSASVVIKLMMVCNDLSLANQSLSEWKKEQPSEAKGRQVGAGMYFVRVQLSHLYEGMKVIEEIKKDPSLLEFINHLVDKTKESFKELEQFLPNAPKRPEFDKLVGLVRHNLTFHYDESGKRIQKALLEKATNPDARVSSITRGDNAYRWHFKVADDIVDSIVVRQIWEISPEFDLRVEADKVADRVHQIFLFFVDFAGEFIWTYCES